MGGGGGGRGIPVEPVSVVVATAGVENMDERPCSFSEITIKFKSQWVYYNSQFKRALSYNTYTCIWASDESF